MATRLARLRECRVSALTVDTAGGDVALMVTGPLLRPTTAAVADVGTLGVLARLQVTAPHTLGG